MTNTSIQITTSVSRHSHGLTENPGFLSTRYLYENSVALGAHYAINCFMYKGGRYEDIYTPNKSMLTRTGLAFNDGQELSRTGYALPVIIVPKSKYSVRLEAVNDSILKILPVT